MFMGRHFDQSVILASDPAFDARNGGTRRLGQQRPFKSDQFRQTVLETLSECSNAVSGLL